MTDDRTALLRDALDQIRELRRRLDEEDKLKHEPIAIVGMSCRFPGEAENVDAYWKLLREGRSAISEVPADRFDIDALYDADPDKPGKTNVRHGGFLRDVAGFDPHFFGISPVEAGSLDPQQRLLLEETWLALEDAGIAPDSLHGSSTGVFVGIGSNDYATLRAREDALEDVDTYLALGTAHSVASGRISYVLGLRGPSYSIDTACSSSLVAVHLALRSLRAKECSVALAGGVAVLLTPDYFVNFSRARMLAVDGRCKTFDAAADGYVRSEGCGMVVLKRLSDALAAGDRIRAVIRGAAANQDGRSSGLTAPNGPSQEDVIRAALADASVGPREIDYVEAHGTGTPLGDPIEAQAVGSVLCEGRGSDERLRIGSAKTNLGHLESAAGIAGVIKTVLALENEFLPAHLNFETPNPHIDWARWALEVVSKGVSWPRSPRPRLAGVSSFGFSGTNAHLILEEAPSEPAAEPPARAAEIITLSGRSIADLRAQAVSWTEHLASHPNSRLVDVALTANAGRTHHAHRVAVVATSPDSLGRALREIAAGHSEGAFFAGRVPGTEAPEVAFLFSGHGSVYPGMGKGLYSWGRVFHAELDHCARLLDAVLEHPLLDALYGGASTLLTQSVYAQPALFALEYALARQWQAYGVQPAAVLGHSAGEFVAACIAGAISLADALRLIEARGRLAHELSGESGSMYALLADLPTVEKALAGTDVSIAAFNGSGNMVISGRNSEIEPVVARLGAQGIRTKRLEIPQAFHSAALDPMLDAFEAIARGCAPAADPQIDYVSNVTGQRPGRGDRLDAAYWRAHARRPVQFERGLNTLLASGYKMFLEIGPASVLSGLGAELPGAEDRMFLPSLGAEIDDGQAMLEALGRLHVSGVAIDWREVAAGQGARAVSLPVTRFDRQRCWFREGPAVSRSVPGAGSAFARCSLAAARQADQGPFDLDPHSFPAKWESLAAFTLAYQVDALRQMGAFSTAGETHTAQSLCEKCGIAPTHRRLMERWLEHLALRRLVDREGEAYRAPAPLPESQLEDRRREASQIAGDYPEMLAYVESCGPRLAAVLRGVVSPLDTLFPDGSFEIADGLYNRSAVARYLNFMVRAAVEAVAASVPPGRKLRVLEIGAGTGGTTAAVLPVLDPERTEYVFTDVSDFFFDRARERVREFPYLTLARLDMEKDPNGQGFGAGTFDLVIAANVLHATRDLGLTLDRVAWLLGSGGVAVLNETTSHPRVFDITTGLIEGWQIFEDPLRRDNPLVSAAAWVAQLLAHGFEEARAFPGPDEAAAALGNHVIVAGRPGRALAGRAATMEAIPAEAQAAVGGPDGIESDVIVSELNAATPPERAEILGGFVRSRVMRILRLDEAHKPDLDARLIDLGLDSLMAVQLRNKIAIGLRLPRKLPATLVFDYPSIGAIAAFLSSEMFGAPGKVDSAAGVEPAPTIRVGVEDVESLTEAEAETLLLRHLAQLQEKQ